MEEQVGIRTWVAVAIALLLWAAAFAGIRAGLAAYPGFASYSPGQLALFRFLAASLTLGAFSLVRRVRKPHRRDLREILLAGLLGITFYHLALNYGEVKVSAGAASLLISAGPIFTALLAVMLLHERLNTWGWAGIIVAFSGVALITFGEGEGFGFEPRTVLVLLAAMSTAGYFIVSKRPLRRYDAFEFTAWAVWLGTAPMLVFLPGLLRVVPNAAPEATAAALFLGVFPGAVSYLLWSYALARMPASRLASFLYLQPANAIVIAWIWIGEVPSLLTLLGGTVAFAGVVLVNTRGRPTTEAA